MSMIDGGRLLAKALKQQGITHVFTLCGGHIVPAYQGCIDEGLQIIDFRHEQAAAFAAEGWAKITGRPGLCLATAGPGVPNTVTPVANAFNNSTPLVVIGAGNEQSGMREGQSQQLSHCEYMSPITRFTARVTTASRIPEFVNRAFNATMGPRKGPVFLEIPSDLLSKHINYSSKLAAVECDIQPRENMDSAKIRQAAGLIRKAERPVIVAGSSIWWCNASSDLKDLAELAGIPVYLISLARGSMPADHPLCFSLSRHFALSHADLIIILGTPLDFRLNYGLAPVFNARAGIIQVDVDANNIGKNRQVDIGICGDLKAIINGIYSEDRFLVNRTAPWIRKLREQESALWLKYSALFKSDAVPVHPLRLCYEIGRFIGGNSTIVLDGGNIARFAAHVLHTDRPGRWLDPGPMGTLGAGTGYAIAARLANPRERVLIVHGDGSFGLGSMEFDTMVRHKLPVVSVIGNDGGWGQVRQIQVELKCSDTAVKLGNNTRYDKLVESLGGHGEFVRNPKQIRPALERAFASGKPACVNVITDPSVFYESNR